MVILRSRFTGAFFFLLQLWQLVFASQFALAEPSPFFRFEGVYRLRFDTQADDRPPYLAHVSSLVVVDTGLKDQDGVVVTLFSACNYFMCVGKRAEVVMANAKIEKTADGEVLKARSREGDIGRDVGIFLALEKDGTMKGGIYSSAHDITRAEKSTFHFSGKQEVGPAEYLTATNPNMDQDSIFTDAQFLSSSPLARSESERLPPIPIAPVDFLKADFNRDKKSRELQEEEDAWIVNPPTVNLMAAPLRRPGLESALEAAVARVPKKTIQDEGIDSGLNIITREGRVTGALTLKNTVGKPIPMITFESGGWRDFERDGFEPQKYLTLVSVVRNEFWILSYIKWIITRTIDPETSQVRWHGFSFSGLNAMWKKFDLYKGEDLD